MALFNFRLLFLDSARSLFKIDDPYVTSKLKSSEPSSARLWTEPAGRLARYNNLTREFLFQNGGGPCLHIAFKRKTWINH